MSKAYPTPWTFEAEDVFEDSPIRSANGEYVLVRDSGVYPPDLDTCREIVEAVNWYRDWGALSGELERLRNERDRLRDLVKRMASKLKVHRGIFVGAGVWDETKQGETCDLIKEARAAIGAGENPYGKGVG